MTKDEMNTIARALFDRYPRRYKEILYGMAETSQEPFLVGRASCSWWVFCL